MRAERWFHTLVVVGASLSACGGRAQSTVESEGDNSSGGTAAGGAGNGGVGGSAAAGQAGAAGTSKPLVPQDCSYHQRFFCASYEPPTDCFCDAKAPLSAAFCEQRLDFQCREVTGFGYTAYVACYCGPRELTPDDCAVPASFFCNVTYPAFADCHCDGPVVLESDCRDGNVLCCQGSEPRFGCECCSLVIK
jgi:hypothetical protein